MRTTTASTTNDESSQTTTDSETVDTEILHGIDLHVTPGRVHALMGPNGCGKSTLALTLAGHPQYRVLAGSVYLDGQDLLALSPDERSRAGLFLSFQHPIAVPGVTVANFLRSALMARSDEPLNASAFRRQVFERLEQLDLDPGFLGRAVNDGFSGGEKKRLEMLQMAMLRPRYAILDETDSGLDVDALRAVGNAVRAYRAEAPGNATGFLIITHYPRILEHIVPDVVHVMIDGRIVASGGPELAAQIEREGFEAIRQSTGGVATR